jgi:hypothetical protein
MALSNSVTFAESLYQSPDLKSGMGGGFEQILRSLIKHVNKKI